MTIILASCYVPPHSVDNLIVQHDNTIWVEGRELVKLEKDSISVVINFDQTINNRSMFDLIIVNNTEEPVLISPTDFYCVTNNRLNEERVVKASDPERIIQSYNRSMEKLKADIKHEENNELIFALFDLVHDIAEKDETIQEENQERLERLERERRSENKIYQSKKELERTENSKSHISSKALRKTTLFPGKSMQGKIYFKLSRRIKQLKLYLPIDDVEFLLDYDRI